MSDVVAFDLRSAVGRPTGVGRYLLSVATAATRLPGVSVRAYVRGNQRATAAAALDRSIDIVRISAPGPLWHLSVWRHARRHRVRAYVSTSLIVPALPGVPALPVILDVVGFRLPGLQQLRTRVFERLLMKRVVRIHPLILLSNATASDTADLFGPVRGVVVPPWFDAPDRPAGVPPSAAADLEAMEIHGRYVLMVGTVEPRKNVLFAARVVDILRTRGHDLRLVLAGRRGWVSREEFDGLRDLEEAGAVVWPGYVTDAQREMLYAGAAAVLLPSMYEGFGMPLIEAMARGVPCCCSDIPVFGEVAGDAAVVAPVSDREAWIRVLASVLDDATLRDRLKAAGRERAAEYTINRTAEALRAALAQLD